MSVIAGIAIVYSRALVGHFVASVAFKENLYENVHRI